jgi:hypothetical protein
MPPSSTLHPDCLVGANPIIWSNDDFNELASIASPYDEAIKALGSKEFERADSKIRLALTNALTADELTKADRRRVVDTLKADYELAKETQGVDAVAGELRQVQTLLDGSEDLRRLVRSPVFRADAQIAGLQAILKAIGIGQLASNFMSASTINWISLSNEVRGSQLRSALARL